MSKTVRPQPGLDPIVTYIPGKPIEDVKRELGLDDVIKLASNENPLGVSPKALAAMREALPNVNLYPDGASYKLRQALADHFGLLMDQVAVGNGADDLILELSMAYIGEGDQVIASYSSFPLYDIYTHAMRGVMIKTPLARGYRIDLDAMAAAITHRTKMIYVCNPNNPTGTIARSRADRHRRGLLRNGRGQRVPGFLLLPSRRRAERLHPANLLQGLWPGGSASRLWIRPSRRCRTAPQDQTGVQRQRSGTGGRARSVGGHGISRALGRDELYRPALPVS